MQLATATAAGALAAQITGLQAVIAELQQLAAGGSTLGGQVTVTDAGGNANSMTLPAMTAPESATIITAAIAVYQARVNALTTQLNGM